MKQNDKQYLGIVYYLGATIWHHGATREDAAQLAAKQAKRDLRHYLKRGAKVDWKVNLFEVGGQDWSLDGYTSQVTLEDGTDVRCIGHLPVTA
jgi:hypothetical protein